MTEPQSGVGDEGGRRESALRRWDPDRIGPYVILGRLGAGAMGQVYLGRSAAGRLVAVKTIKVDLAEEAGFRTRFAQEVAAARRVSGFFTAAVVEADPEADLPWLATAYVPAPSLARLVKACGPLPVGTVRWLAAGCAEALESIHSVGLVHRDLKPSNVLVAPDGPRVIDFGVARAAERMGVTTSRGTVGTPAYMAPEQARDTHQASAASDVYALGATLAFAATGHPPYQGDTVMDVLARLATEEPDLSGLPGELTELIGGLPAARPAGSPHLVRDAGPARAVHRDPAGGGRGALLPARRGHGPDRAVPAQPPAGQRPGPAEEDSGAGRHLRLLHRTARLLPAQAPRTSRAPAGLGRAGGSGSGTHMAWVGWVSVGAALVVGGVILGASLSSNGSPVPPGLPPPPTTSAIRPIRPAPARLCAW